MPVALARFVFVVPSERLPVMCIWKYAPPPVVAAEPFAAAGMVTDPMVCVVPVVLTCSTNVPLKA